MSQLRNRHLEEPKDVFYAAFVNKTVSGSGGQKRGLWGTQAQQDTPPPTVLVLGHWLALRAAWLSCILLWNAVVKSRES